MVSRSTGVMAYTNKEAVNGFTMLISSWNTILYLDHGDTRSLIWTILQSPELKPMIDEIKEDLALYNKD